MSAVLVALLERLGLTDYLRELRERMRFAAYLDEITARAEDGARLFSSAGREDSERMTCAGFLRCLGHPFSTADLQWEPNDPPDVHVDRAEFEVTRALERGHHPVGEFQEEANALRIIEDPDALVGPYTPREPTMTFDELLGEVERAARSKVYAAAVCRGLDLLVYVNFPDCLLDRTTVSTTAPGLHTLAALGWRSVSFVTDCEGFVCSAALTAPTWLTSRVGTLYPGRPEDIWHPGGLFRLE